MVLEKLRAHHSAESLPDLVNGTHFLHLVYDLLFALEEQIPDDKGLKRCSVLVLFTVGSDYEQKKVENLLHAQLPAKIFTEVALDFLRQVDGLFVANLERRVNTVGY